jgi:hypothetical protein
VAHVNLMQAVIAVMLGREGTLVEMQVPERRQDGELARRAGCRSACSSTIPTT